MGKWTLALLAILFVASCAQDNTEEAKEAAKSGLSGLLRAEFGELLNFPGGVVCGEYEAFARYDESEGIYSFIYRDGTANMNPSDDDKAVFCGKDPAAQFQARFKTISPGQAGSSLAKIQQHMNELDNALNAYLADNEMYPVTLQGLEALLKASETYPKPTNFRAGGYLSAVPKDPWGRPYQYTSEEVLRMEPRTYTLLTLGKDGAEGGTGEDADIGSHQLKYLNHLDNL